MSSPTSTSTPKRSTRRTTPKRNPLQERSSSEKNEEAGRLKRDSRSQLTDSDIFTTTPFPTKPQHVLLPSTVRKQQTRQNLENERPNFFTMALPEPFHAPTLATTAPRDDRRLRKAPKIQLKRSVTALRDIYEAQSEISRPSTAVQSRPSTAGLSPSLRPSSSRLRSISSSEGFSGRHAWDTLGLPKVSVDDISMLPTLSEHGVFPLDSERSFAARLRNPEVSSSPNFRALGLPSPNMPPYRDMTSSDDPMEGSSSFGANLQATSSSNYVVLDHSSSLLSTDPTPFSLAEDVEATSPNVVHLGRTSSVADTDPTPPTLNDEDQDSSPILEKLGSTSPMRSDSPANSQSSLNSKKRKRPAAESSAWAGRTPLFGRSQRQYIPSSPPVRNLPDGSDASLGSMEQRHLPSSPPEIGSTTSHSQPTSSPVLRVFPGRMSTDASSIVSAHTNLQSVLASSSSPAPLPPRPIVRAPNINQFEILASQKRHALLRSQAGNTTSARLSPVPSISNFDPQRLSVADQMLIEANRTSSRVSIFIEDLDEVILGTDLVEPAPGYMMHHEMNSSQVNMISDDDRHEAADALSALPRQHSSFAAVLSQARSASLPGSNSNSNTMSAFSSLRTSMDERFQSMRSFTHVRHDSYRSLHRPGSAASQMSATILPAWARRYYSGIYQDSFQYLYQSTRNLGYSVTHLPPPSRNQSISASIPASSSFETISTISNLGRSVSRSLRSSIRNIVPSLHIPPIRQRLNVRQSHITAGVGPLVSNPINTSSEVFARPPTAYQNRRTIRRVSVPLSAVDPRYHWNGIVEELDDIENEKKMESSATQQSLTPSQTSVKQKYLRRSLDRFGRPFHSIRVPTPHLHHDRRLNTGSSASLGFGAPYNIRPKWQPPSGHTDELGRPAWFTVDLRDLQVVCFMAGFVLPPAWFIGAFTKLPKRPDGYHDMEKGEPGVHHDHGDEYLVHGAAEDGDIVARLRLERHIRGLEEIKFQNARWWQRMNRWMCVVGIIVLIVVIILAVIGTRSSWS